MAINYYETEFGRFTAIVDSTIYSTVNSSNVATYPPWEDVETTVAVANVTYNQDALNFISTRIKSLHLKTFTGLTTSTQEFYYDFASNPERKIRLGISYYRNIADIRTGFNFVVAGMEWGGSRNGYAPYGSFSTYNSGGSVPDRISIEVPVFNDDMSAVKIITMWVRSNGAFTYDVHTPSTAATICAFFAGVEPIFVPSPDPYDQAGGGEGALPGSQTIGLPDEPTLSPIDAGLFSLYSPTSAQMRSLANFLWTDFGGTGTTVEQVLEEVVEALKRSVSNPLNSMLGLSIIASQGLSKGSDSSVHVGFWDTGVSMTKLTKQYFNVDCGSLSFNPVCGNTFLDYAPYSKFMIFLPYVGMRLLDANDVVGHTISIKYRGDCVSGALTCYVIRDGTVIQEHTGNCALNIPLTADSWAETISSVGRIISGSVSAATRGGAAGAAAGAVRGAASVATNPSAFSPQVAHTGAVSGAAGHLGSQKPFILREAVRFHSTANFNSIIGYPSYHYRKLADCHGYTQCLEVHLSHTPCTGVELQEIEDLLKKGVII